jgi:hypothetical protein
MLTSKLVGNDRLLRQVALLSLSSKRKKKLHQKLGREVVKQSRARIRQQKTVDGNSFAKRKSGKKKKLLTRIMRNVKVYAGSKSAKVTWADNKTGKIASAHQRGHTETNTAAKVASQRGRPDYNAQATKDQAKALIRAGYKRPTGKYKSGNKRSQIKSSRVSQKWITENMTLGQAGLVLRMLSGKSSKSSWQVKTPERPFLGANKSDVKQMANMVIDEFLSDMKRT